MVQTSAEVWSSVIPAKAGIQGRIVINQKSSLGSGESRSDGGNPEGSVDSICRSFEIVP
ncbi:MAG: hypothetical protein O2860_01505 [Chloroflexi bacterium]|nr:hypothetical protein [Chloroflexota bacterium]